MPRHTHLHRHHRCHRVSKLGMADDPKVPLFAPLPPPLSLHERVRDSQQYQGTVLRAAPAVIVVIKQSSRDGKQCQGTVIHAIATIIIVIVARASKRQLTMPRHHHQHCHCRCHCMSKQGRDSQQCQDTTTATIVFV